jgi:hypothetical protein
VLAPWALQQGRAIAWISEALDPLRGELTDREIHQLAPAIRSATASKPSAGTPMSRTSIATNQLL